MSLEDIELENVDRIERLLIQKHGELSNQLMKNIETIKSNLKSFEIDKKLLDRINDVMYNASLTENIEEVEASVRHLAVTFWDQRSDIVD